MQWICHLDIRSTLSSIVWLYVNSLLSKRSYPMFINNVKGLNAIPIKNTGPFSALVVFGVTENNAIKNNSN